MPEIPTVEDWGNWESDLDKSFAFRLYGGKSNSDMLDRYLVAPIEVASELQFMPKKPFQYYMLGFKDSVLTRNHSEFVLPDAASCFLRLVLNKLSKQKEFIIPIMSQLAEAIVYISDNQEIYQADPDIYGDFKEIEKQINILSAHHAQKDTHSE